MKWLLLPPNHITARRRLFTFSRSKSTCSSHKLGGYGLLIFSFAPVLETPPAIQYKDLSPRSKMTHLSAVPNYVSPRSTRIYVPVRQAYISLQKNDVSPCNTGMYIPAVQGCGCDRGGGSFFFFFLSCLSNAIRFLLLCHSTHASRLFLSSDETIVSVVDRNGISDTYGAIATGKFSEIPLVRVGEDFKCRLKGLRVGVLVCADVGN